MPKTFQKHYNFGNEHTIVMKTVEGENLRVEKQKMVDVKPNGGFGEFAQWKVTLIQGGHVAEFKNKKNGKYLRIKGGGDVRGDGDGGALCKFKVHKVKDGHYKLESRKNNGKYVAVRNGKVVCGSGGPFCVLECFKE